MYIYTHGVGYSFTASVYWYLLPGSNYVVTIQHLERFNIMWWYVIWNTNAMNKINFSFDMKSLNIYKKLLK